MKIPVSLQRTSQNKKKTSKESEPSKKWFQKAELEMQNGGSGCDDNIRSMKNR